MENRPVISITAMSRAPGADKDAFERFQQWGTEVYTRISVKLPEVIGTDGYRITKINPEYPETITIGHYKSLKDRLAYVSSSQHSDIVKEFTSWTQRHIIEQIWSTNYVLLKSFRAKRDNSIFIPDTLIENAPILHMEAFRVSQEEGEKYFNWFGNFGCDVFMPLLLKLPGLVGYDWYQNIAEYNRKENLREVDYPKYLSMIYFEDLNPYDNFIKSPERESLEKSMRSIFPFGLKYEWHVQYQLFDSQRK